MISKKRTEFTFAEERSDVDTQAVECLGNQSNDTTKDITQTHKNGIECGVDLLNEATDRRKGKESNIDGSDEALHIGGDGRQKSGDFVCGVVTTNFCQRKDHLRLL